jgi:hypothetical protein
MSQTWRQPRAGLIVAAGAIANPVNDINRRAVIVFAAAFASGAVAFVDKQMGRLGIESPPGMGNCSTLRLSRDARAAGTL